MSRSDDSRPAQTMGVTRLQRLLKKNRLTTSPYFRQLHNPKRFKGRHVSRKSQRLSVGVQIAQRLIDVRQVRNLLRRGFKTSGHFTNSSLMYVRRGFITTLQKSNSGLKAKRGQLAPTKVTNTHHVHRQFLFSRRLGLTRRIGLTGLYFQMKRFKNFSRDSYQEFRSPSDLPLRLHRLFLPSYYKVLNSLEYRTNKN